VGRALDSEVDVVVVAYNSSATLRNCVQELADVPELHVFVVDNASADDSAASVRDLNVTLIEADTNNGFGAGCNLGAAAGRSPFILFLNPDARIDANAVQLLAHTAAVDRVGAAAPRIVSSTGDLEHSQRRFPSLASTYAQGLFLHRILPRASWTDEVVRDDASYEHPQSPDWVSGACVLVRRTVFEQIEGWDESFFLYSEDTDLCRRIRNAGYDVRYEPRGTATHIGGQSSPRASLLPQLAQSRIHYADKHAPTAIALLQRAGIALSSLTHVVAARSSAQRRGHAHAFGAAFRR
jgi:N-acetylglucosaminyl-diphospho-decaprenol L-rhamnosyltransferase